MAPKYTQGQFVPKNPQKLIGGKTPRFRSSWELRCMSFLDTHPNVVQWGSECVTIPYVNPLTGKKTVYVPDFMVEYMDQRGNRRLEMIEVKPRKESVMEAAKSKRDRAFVILNTAKWTAAIKFCSKYGIQFRVINEDDIFVQKGKR